ncbi:MAG: hypothetical protein E1N59_3160 [Puniceicoccaceae bacterium 5H]|nr:MAG: hypothetical protein E1N59_3160 [Puniceicoccaceae bacterium 5H]
MNLLLNIALPVVILGQGDRVTDNAVVVLLVALAFPVGYFVYDLVKRRKYNFISILGFISVLLTGGIGLLQLSRDWFIVKEAAIPAIIGLAVVVSLWTPFPLIRKILYTPQLFDVESITGHLEQRGHVKAFDRLLRRTTLLLGGSFFLSAVLNFLTASYFVKTEPSVDLAQYNAEVGAMTGWSYLIIALPSMLITFGILFYLVRQLERLTGLSFEEMLSPEMRAKQEETQR